MSLIFDLQKSVRYFYKVTNVMPVEIHVSEEFYKELIADDFCQANMVKPKGHPGDMYLMGMVLKIDKDQEAQVRLFGKEDETIN
jgi:hypothetical protein